MTVKKHRRIREQAEGEEQSFRMDENTMAECEVAEDFRMLYGVDCAGTTGRADVGQNKLTGYVVPYISN